MVTLLRDPDGGPIRVLLEFTFEFTKEYLGVKDMYITPPLNSPSHLRCSYSECSLSASPLNTRPHGRTLMACILWACTS